MDSTLEAAMNYTREELDNYARLTDLIDVQSTANRANTIVDTLDYRLGWVEDEFRSFSSSIAGTLGTIDTRGSITEVEQLREEVRQIKEVLIDVQKMLRTLELDDMSKRVGDLNLLLL